MITAGLIDNVTDKANEAAHRSPNSDMPFNLRLKQMFLQEVVNMYGNKESVRINNDALIKLRPFISVKELKDTLAERGCKLQCISS